MFIQVKVINRILRGIESVGVTEFFIVWSDVYFCFDLLFGLQEAAAVHPF